MIGIVLAGGRAERMGGGDKALLPVDGIAMLERVIAVLRAQCDGIILSANGDPARLAGFGCPVVPDGLPDHAGPLAGLLACFDHVAAHHPEAAFVLSVPGDAPFLPSDLVARLEDRRIEDRAAIVHARSAGRDHPIVALWSIALREDLRRAVIRDGVRKVAAFVARHPVATVTWPTLPRDPFLNVNTPDDLTVAERAARE